MAQRPGNEAALILKSHNLSRTYPTWTCSTSPGFLRIDRRNCKILNKMKVSSISDPLQSDHKQSERDTVWPLIIFRR